MGWNITCVTPDYAFQDYYSRAISIKTRLPVLTPVFCLWFIHTFSLEVPNNKHIIYEIVHRACIPSFQQCCTWQDYVYTSYRQTTVMKKHHPINLNEARPAVQQGCQRRGLRQRKLKLYFLQNHPAMVLRRPIKYLRACLDYFVTLMSYFFYSLPDDRCLLSLQTHIYVIQTGLLGSFFMSHQYLL